MEIFMAIILLVSVTAIACNMEKVVKEPTKENGEVVTTKKIKNNTYFISILIFSISIYLKNNKAWNIPYASEALASLYCK